MMRGGSTLGRIDRFPVRAVVGSDVSIAFDEICAVVVLSENSV